MRIAYVTARFPYSNAEQFFEPEVRTLREMGHEVLVVPTRPARSSKSEHSEHDVLRLGLWEPHTLACALGRCSAQTRPTLDVLHDIAARRYRVASKIKNLAVFAKGLALAQYVKSEGVDHIHAHWLSTPSTVAYIASTLAHVPWSCTAHRFDLFEDNLIEEKVRSAAFVRVISERGRTLLAQRVDPARIKVGHLGVAIPRHSTTAEQNGSVHILCAASMVPVKGYEYLIAALAQMKASGVAFECDFAGDGPLRRAIEREILRSGLQNRVHLRGVLDHDYLCAQLANGRYHIAVLASTEDGNQFEGIPVSLMEAMAAGVPCVATSTGSIPELIDDGVCSRLVPQRNAQALADAIAQFALDPQLRTTLGERARERVIESFNARRTTRELLAMIERA